MTSDYDELDRLTGRVERLRRELERDIAAFVKLLPWLEEVSGVRFPSHAQLTGGRFVQDAEAVAELARGIARLADEYETTKVAAWALRQGAA